MVTTRETQQTARDIGRQITDLMESVKPSEAEIVKAGYSREVLRKIMQGENVAQFTKLVDLAKMLKSTPNHILGFNKTAERDGVIGLIEAVAIHFGLPGDEAALLAESAAKALDSPAVRNNHTSRRGSARSVGLHVIEEFLMPKHQ